MINLFKPALVSIQYESKNFYSICNSEFQMYVFKTVTKSCEVLNDNYLKIIDYKKNHIVN